MCTVRDRANLNLSQVATKHLKELGRCLKIYVNDAELKKMEETKHTTALSLSASLLAASWRNRKPEVIFEVCIQSAKARTGHK